MYHSRIPKYRNIKVTNQNGEKFDSKREMQKYHEYELLCKAGKINGLQRQVKFVLQEKCRCCGEVHAIYNRKRGVRIYIADWTYYDENGQIKVVDAKGYKTQRYLENKEIMQKMGYEIIEV